MVNISDAIKALYPAANLMPGGNVVLTQEATDPAPRISQWDPMLGPQPTDAQLAAVVINYSGARISAAWSAADALAQSVIDHNSREQFIVWLINPSSSAAKKAAIGDCLAWMAGIWAAYEAVKSQILAGTDVQFSYVTPCPHTFWEVASL